MDKKEFEYSMKRGLGRCILELKHSDDIGQFREAVLKGCLNNYSYDAQCEGTRSEYMYLLLSYFGDDKYFEDKIIDRFNSRISGQWLFNHLANMLYLFADDGSEKSYKAMVCKYDSMYLGLRKNMPKDKWQQFEWLCIWLVELKGFNWFKKIVSDLGNYYERQAKRQERPVLYSFDWFWSACKDRCHEKNMEKFVSESSREGIKIFRDSLSRFVRRAGEHGKDSKQEIPTARQLEEECLNCVKDINYRSRMLRFAHHASDGQVTELAEIIIHIKDNKELQAGLLKVFHIRTFPADVVYLIDFSEDRDRILAKSALEALSIIKSKAVKEYAYRLIKEKRNLPYALCILFCNYDKEDNDVILNLLKQQKISYSEHLWHHVFHRALDWLEGNRDAPDEAVCYIYENTLCSMCRECAVELMIDRGIVAKDIREECRFDSNSDIRDMV